MKLEVHMNLSMTFWFISCLLCIQNLVYCSSFTTKSYSLCFFYYCYYWLTLVRTLFNLLFIWHLCRPLYSCPIEFFISSFMSLFAAAHTDLQLLSENWRTESTDNAEHPEQGLPCNSVSQSCITADLFLISLKYKFINYPKRRVFSSLSQHVLIVSKIKIMWLNKKLLFSYPAHLKSQMSLQVYMVIVHPWSLRLGVSWRLWSCCILLDQLYKDFKRNWVKPEFTYLLRS